MFGDGKIPKQTPKQPACAKKHNMHARLGFRHFRVFLIYEALDVPVYTPKFSLSALVLSLGTVYHHRVALSGRRFRTDTGTRSITKTIIAIQVPLSSQLHKTGGNIFLRSEDGDYRVQGTHQLAGLINRKLGLFTEQRTIPYLTVSDLRPELFDRARRLMRSYYSQHPWVGLSDEELLKIGGFYAVDGETGKTCLTPRDENTFISVLDWMIQPAAASKPSISSLAACSGCWFGPLMS